MTDVALSDLAPGAVTDAALDAYDADFHQTAITVLGERPLTWEEITRLMEANAALIGDSRRLREALRLVLDALDRPEGASWSDSNNQATTIAETALGLRKHA